MVELANKGYSFNVDIMLKVGVGFSKNKHPEVAAREAVLAALKQAGIKKADLILVFATSHFHQEYARVLNILYELASPKQLCGCSAYGILTDEEEVEQSPSIAVLTLKSNSIQSRAFQVHNILDRNSEVGMELAELLIENLQQKSLLLLLPDTFNFHFDAFYHSFSKSISSPLAPHSPFMIGGGASEEGNLNETFQFCGRTVDSNSISGLLLSGKFQFEVGITHACHPIGSSLMVTKAKGNTIYEICGKPAYQTFSELFKNKLHHQEELHDAASLVFLGLGVNPCDTSLRKKEYIVRNILALDPEEETITVSDRIEEGKVISYMVRDPKRSYEETEEMIFNLSKRFENNSPRFGIYINCCGRGNSLYGKKNVDISLIRKYFKEMPLIGFFSYAELISTGCGSQWHNYSGILSVFGET
ncbi:MAG: FIST C-terminal domain-containing protein [Nitrospirae bacterium]|nr:FIST C-terminal domain-containing protein [Nitrospirota bacterium]MBI3353107.1 FIST C-terminal domain-containing protein [Nitrospirota bacterium]